MDTKITKVIVLNILLIGLVLFLSGCGNQVYTPEVSPISPTLTITTCLPSATVLATETQLPPYPTSSENFVKTPSISGSDAEKRIVELGAGEDLSALKDWYKANGIANSSMLPVIYEEGGDVHWDMAAKSGNGNFLKFTITSGAEANQDVRAMGMVSYLYNRPTFKTSELKTPAELSGTTQEITWDKSGWSVVGTFRDGSYTGWFNADQNMWIAEESQVVEATAAPEYIPIHSSLDVEGNVDGVPVKTIFAIGQDIYDRSELPIDKWIVNPKAEEMLNPGSVQDMVSRVILEAHYHAWQSDNYSDRKSVSFDEYTQRLKSGEDMSYEIAAAVLGSFLDTTVKKANPMKPFTFVLVNKPGGFSFGNTAKDISLFNYVEDDGSLRMELFTSLDFMRTIYDTDFTKNDQLYSVEIMLEMASSLHFLSFDPEYQKPTVGTLDFNIYSSEIRNQRPELRSGDSFILNPEVGQFSEGVTPLIVTRK